MKIDIFPDYAACEITIGPVQSHSNLVRALAIIPWDKHTKGSFEECMERAELIASALEPEPVLSGLEARDAMFDAGGAL